MLIFLSSRPEGRTGSIPAYSNLKRYYYVEVAELADAHGHRGVFSIAQGGTHFLKVQALPSARVRLITR